MNRFEEPVMKVVRFTSDDVITTSTGGSYFAGNNDNNSYINEDDYEMSQNPWA